MGSLRFKVGDIPEGEGRVLGAGDKEFAVFKLEGQLYALDNVCSHRGGPIGEGFVCDGAVTCPWHGFDFDIKTGGCIGYPAYQQATFPVTVHGDEAEINWT